MGLQRVRHNRVINMFIYGIIKNINIYFNWHIVDLVVPISAVQQSDSVTHTHTYIYIHIIFKYSFLYDLSKDTEYDSLCYTLGPCLSILNVMVCIYQPQTPSPSFSLLLLLVTTSLISMTVSLFLFCRQVHLCHMLDYTYVKLYGICLSLSDLVHLVW